MRNLTNKEVGYVSGAGTYGKPVAGNNRGNVEGRGKGKAKKAAKVKVKTDTETDTDTD